MPYHSAENAVIADSSKERHQHEPAPLTLQVTRADSQALWNKRSQGDVPAEFGKLEITGAGTVMEYSARRVGEKSFALGLDCETGTVE